MENVSSIILNSVWGVIEFCNLFLIAKYFLLIEPVRRRIELKIAALISYITIIVGFSLTIKTKVPIEGLFIFLFTIKSFILLSVLFKVRFRHLLMNLFYVALTSSVASDIDLLFQFVVNKKVPYENIFCEIVAALIFLAFFAIIRLLERSNRIYVLFANLSSGDYILILIIIYSVSILENGILDSAKYSESAKVLVVLAYVAIAIFICRTMIIVESKSLLEGTNYLLEKQIAQTTAYYNDLVERDTQIRKFRHDIKNLLIALHKLIQEDEKERAITYIEELQKICNQGAKKYDSGNFIADAIITTKANAAEKSDIAISVDGFIPSEKVKDVDMVIILSNLLDNAVKASEKIKGKKDIKIKSTLRKNLWVMVMENPSEEVVIYGKNTIKTSKINQEFHGFGLRNIKRAVDSYNGSFNCEYNNGVFKSTVSLFLE